MWLRFHHGGVGATANDSSDFERRSGAGREAVVSSEHDVTTLKLSARHDVKTAAHVCVCH